MEPRLPYRNLSTEPIVAFQGVNEYLRRSTLERKLIELIFLRASQINGCAFCIDMHVRDARAAGESDRRLHGVAAWHEMPFFSERERAALAWTEAVTKISETHARQSEFDALRPLFTDQEIADLTVAVGLINLWNRLAISFRMPVPMEEPSPEAIAEAA